MIRIGGALLEISAGRDRTWKKCVDGEVVIVRADASRSQMAGASW